jgi:hypothetical protein
VQGATNRPAAEFEALALPDEIMTLTRTNQSVSNLVQDGVADFILDVVVHEVTRKLDGLAVVKTATAETLAVIPAA